MYLEQDYFLDDFYSERESWGFYSDTDDIDTILLNFKGDKEKLNFLLTSRNYVCPSYFIAESIVEKTNKNVWFYSFDKVRDGKKARKWEHIMEQNYPTSLILMITGFPHLNLTIK